MTPDASDTKPHWDEQNSQHFIDYGKYFVPDREDQINYICSLIPATDQGHIVDLACGEGILCEALLERFPGCVVHGFDGSPRMLQQASQRLARYGERFQTRLFDLADTSWRDIPWPLHAIVSSLAIHHLDGPQKQQLYKDIYRMLEPGGMLVVADLMQPVTEQGITLAGRMWDQAVRERSLKLDGNLSAYERFKEMEWNSFTLAEPDPVDKMSPLFDQLKWLEEAGFEGIDVYWLKAAHAIFGGRRRVTSDE